jgi:hypothetical protein
MGHQQYTVGDRKARKGDGGKQVHASDVRCSFMFLDRSLPYGRMFAIFEIPGVGAEPTIDPGLNHMQFKHIGVTDLIERAHTARCRYPPTSMRESWADHELLFQGPGPERRRVAQQQL